MDQEQRREQRHAFIAYVEVLEQNSGALMSSQISDLSLGGCYVDTVNPLPDGTPVHLKILTETHSFEAPAKVAYSHAFLGMGVKFLDVQPKFEEVLHLWPPQPAEKSNEAHG